MFKEKLKKAMQDLNINQSKLSTLTGIGKSSISQYLSGKNEPTDERAQFIAESLGLDLNYFTDESVVTVTTSNSAIKRLLPRDAARLMGVSKEVLRKGLQDERYPWGYAVQTSSRWHYWINAKKFSEIERIDLGLEDDE